MASSQTEPIRADGPTNIGLRVIDPATFITALQNRVEGRADTHRARSTPEQRKADILACFAHIDFAKPPTVS